MKMMGKAITKGCSIALAILMGITLLMATGMDVNAQQSGVEMTEDEKYEVDTENENKEDENTILEDPQETLENVDIQEEDTAKIASARNSKYKFMWLYLIPGPSAVIFLVFFFKEKAKSKSNNNEVREVK